MTSGEALQLHYQLRGKIEIKSKIPLKNRKQLSLLYTPGVAEASKAIANGANPFELTMKQNTVGIVTDGSRVLGLGNIGPEAALPVMEGKAILFNELAGIDAFPLCLATQKASGIIKTVKMVAPVFGAINLEDIETPKCFAVEQKLQKIGIPVMHDDQHGTAIAALAGLINAAKVTGKKFEQLKIVVNGSGAAGSAIAKLLVCSGQDRQLCQSAGEVIALDSQGIIHKKRKGLSPEKKKLARITNPEQKQGGLEEALQGADAFIGVSKGNILTAPMIQCMNQKPIIFALANPVPEIEPALALQAGASIVATGRSDFPNQINNALAFPGIFRGALDSKATRISNRMKLHAAYAIAATVPKPRRNYILPSVFEKQLVKNVSKAVQETSANQ